MFSLLNHQLSVWLTGPRATHTWWGEKVLENECIMSHAKTQLRLSQAVFGPMSMQKGSSPGEPADSPNTCWHKNKKAELLMAV